MFFFLLAFFFLQFFFFCLASPAPTNPTYCFIIEVFTTVGFFFGSFCFLIQIHWIFFFSLLQPILNYLFISFFIFIYLLIFFFFHF